MKPDSRHAVPAVVFVLLIIAAVSWNPAATSLAGRSAGDTGSPDAAAASAPREGASRPTDMALSSRPGASYAALAVDGADRAPSARGAGSFVGAVGTGAGAPPVVDPDAARRLADALRNGDERSPPIIASSTPVERASAAELADPAAYRRYERRGQAKLYRAFEQEAVIALNDLDRDLRRARAAGLSPEQIAEGEEKQRVLAETLERLRQGEFGDR